MRFAPPFALVAQSWTPMSDPIHDYLAAIGRRGGQAGTAAQNAARVANGKLGGRPKGKRPSRRKLKTGSQFQSLEK